MNNLEETCKELKNYIDGIKNDALNSGKKDDAASSISYIGMILDELSNSYKKDNPLPLNKISEGLDDKLVSILYDLIHYNDNNGPDVKIPEKLDALSSYCNDVFMSLMAGDSCAIPENYRN